MRAYREGHFSFCSEALSESLQPAALSLRVRALLRTGQFSDVLAALENVDFSTLTHEDAGELLALKSTALCLLGDARADETLVDARVRAYSSGSPAVECEVEYVTASLAWAEGRIADVFWGVNRVLAVSEKNPTWLRKPRSDAFCSPAYWRARALDLRGLAEAVDEDFVAQSKSLMSAFGELDQSPVRDLYIEASMLYNLAVLARDIDSPDVAPFVAERAETIAWNANTKHFEYEVFRSLGWCYAQQGDHLGAFRHLRRSADAAPSIPLKIVAILDRGFLARELGEVFTATEDIEHALRLTTQVDWERTTGAERNALYILAAGIAATDVKKARQLWSRFSELKSSVSPFELYTRGNRRERAAQCQAHATILTAEGDRERAVSLLLDSLNIWSEVGYLWRRAAVAADLAELTGEARYFDIAASQAAKKPHSWLARRLSALAGPSSR